MKFITQWCAQTGAMLAMLGIAVGIGVFAVAFLSAALCLALIEPLGTPLAAMVTGGVLLAAAALLLLAVRYSAQRPRQQLERSAQPDGQVTAAKLGEMLGEGGATLIKRHPGATMLAALVAGFVVGSNPKMRDEISRIL